MCSSLGQKDSQPDLDHIIVWKGWRKEEVPQKKRSLFSEERRTAWLTNSQVYGALTICQTAHVEAGARARIILRI